MPAPGAARTGGRSISTYGAPPPSRDPETPSLGGTHSGCRAGEVVGVIVAAGLLSLGNRWVTGITFVLAYVAGYALTVGPLIQDGEPARTALADALYSETASITVMEVTALGVDRWIGGAAGMGDVLFWTALVVSLTMGLAAAYPVNVRPVHTGVKEGTADPTQAAA